MPDETLVIHADYREQFARRGLTDARAFLDLPGDVVSGHPDRHVVRVVLGEGKSRVVAYLKREHRIPLRDRPMNALAGFGWVTKSAREAATLRAMRDAGLPVPAVLAFGDDGRGRAFLLVRAARGAVDLQTILSLSPLSAAKRAVLAKRLGSLLARFHAAGFDLPDLTCKHVLYHPRRGEFTLIDVPRSRRAEVSWPTRLGDLARLHASLANSLASLRERLVALRGYLGRKARLSEWARPLERMAQRLRRKRLVPKVSREAMPKQRLRWLDGERLVMTRRFWRRCSASPPDWLAVAARTTTDKPRRSNVYWDGCVLTLAQSPPAAYWRRIVARVCGTFVPSQDARLAGLHNRLEQAGVRTPRLLAFGRKPDGSGFLLTRPLVDTLPLASWLHRPHPRRAAILREAGGVLSRLHAAGVRLDGFPFALQVRGPLSRRPSVVLADVRSVRKLPRSAGRMPLIDLGRFVRSLDLTDREALGVVRGYLGMTSERAECRELLHELWAGLPPRRGRAA